MKARMIRVAVVGGSLAVSAVVAGCSGASGASPSAASSPAAIATPATTLHAMTTAPEPTRTAEPTLASTFELAVTEPAGAVAVKLTLNPSPMFDPAAISAPAGDIVLYLSNPADAGSPSRHNFRIGPVLNTELAHTPELKVGESGVFTLESVPAGRYIYWCTVDSHYLGGMRRVLTVTP